MANQNLTQKSATTTTAGGDLLYVLRDPLGTPIDNKITVSNFANSIGIPGGTFTPTEVAYADAGGVLTGDAQFARDSSTHETTIQATFGGQDSSFVLSDNIAGAGLSGAAIGHSAPDGDAFIFVGNGGVFGLGNYDILLDSSSLTGAESSIALQGDLGVIGITGKDDSGNKGQMVLTPNNCSFGGFDTSNSGFFVGASSAGINIGQLVSGTPSVLYIFPLADGITPGMVLQTDAAGNTSFDNVHARNVTGTNGEVAYFDNTTGRLTSDNNFTWNQNTLDFMVGDLNGVANHTSLTVNDNGSLISASGTKGISDSGVVFSGSGLDDFTKSALFTGNATTTYTITIDSLNANAFLASSATQGDINPGDSLTDTTTGATGTVIGGSVGTTANKYSYTLTSGSPFASGNSITNNTTSFVFSMINLGTYDTFTWTDGTTTEVGNVCASSMPFSHGVFGNFGSQTGHTINDSWTFTYTVSYGRTLALDGSVNLYTIGDVDGINNQTNFQIDDTNKFIIGQVDGVFGIDSSNGNGWFQTDTVNKITKIGDISNANNGTKFIVNDVDSDILSYGTVGGTSNFLGLNIDYAFDIYQLGDVQQLKNHVGLTLDNANQQASINGNETSGSFGYMLLLDGANNLFKLGDITGVGNSTLLTIDDVAKDISNTVIGGTYQIKGFGNISSDRSLLVDNATRIITIGDVDYDFNGNKFVVDDVNSNIAAFVQNGGSFDVRSQTPGDVWLSVSPGSFTAAMGDIDTVNNGTYFSIDDPDGNISAVAGNTFRIFDTLGSVWFNTDTANHKVTLGDASGDFNVTRLVVDDTAKAMYMQSGGNLYLNIDVVGNLYEFGDLSVSGVGIIIQPATNNITLNGGIKYNQVIQSGTFSVSTAMYYIDIDTTGGVATANLPAAASAPAGTTFILTDYLGNALVNNITLVANGADTIQGSATLVINTNYGSRTIHSDGATQWIVT